MAGRKNEKRQTKSKANVSLSPTRESRTSPRGAKQTDYLKAIDTKEMVFALGPAGTGKTFVAASRAVDLVVDKKLEKIILCRPTVEAEERLGFLPGDINSKMEPWTAPLMDVVSEKLGKQELARWIRDGKIEVIPFAFMRGRTFRNAFIILDEAQNTTVEQMKLFLTRIGENVKVIVNGDLTQKDIKREDGLTRAIKLAVKCNIPCGIVYFNRQDVVRSALCAAWVAAFEAEEADATAS